MSQTFQQYYNNLLAAAEASDIKLFKKILQIPSNNTICRNNRVLVKAYNEDCVVLIRYLKTYCDNLRLDLIEPDLFYAGILNNQVVHAVLDYTEHYQLSLQLAQAIKLGDVRTVAKVLGVISYVDFDEILRADANLYQSEVVQKYL